MQLILDKLSVEISHKKIQPTLVIPPLKPAILVKPEERQPTDIEIEGQVYRFVDKTRNYYNRESMVLIGDKSKVTYRDEYVVAGRVLTTEEIVHLTNDERGWSRSKPFERSLNIVPKMWVKASEIHNYIIKNVYEVYVHQRKYNKSEYATMISKLYELTEEKIQEGLVGMNSWVFKEGSKQVWIQFIVPQIIKTEEGYKFGWLQLFTNSRLHHEHFMDVTVSAPTQEAIPPEVRLEEFLSAAPVVQ